MMLDISDLTEEEVRELRTALLGGAGQYRYDAARASRLVTTGYEHRAGGTLSSEADRMAMRARLLDNLAAQIPKIGG